MGMEVYESVYIAKLSGYLTTACGYLTCMFLLLTPAAIERM